MFEGGRGNRRSGEEEHNRYDLDLIGHFTGVHRGENHFLKTKSKKPGSEKGGRKCDG